MALFCIDTETTGLDPATGDRMVEFGAVRLERVEGGWRYPGDDPEARKLLRFNPLRSVPAEAFKVHGLSRAFLAMHPTFGEQAAAIVEFLDLKNASLHTYAAHNSSFDLSFIKSEFKAIGYDEIVDDLHVEDTLERSKRIFKSATRHTLDALCKRLGVDNAKRTMHGALMDADLLARVVIGMDFEERRMAAFDKMTGTDAVPVQRTAYEGGISRMFENAADRAAHADGIKKIKNAIWAQYEGQDSPSETPAASAP